MSRDVVILGAGPAGISAAWRLCEAGVKARVLEADDAVGGLSKTLRRDGYLFDLGPHRFHSDNPSILDRVTELTGPLPAMPRRTRVYFLGKFFEYPLSATNLLASLPPLLGASCFLDFLVTWARNRVSPPIDDSFESWVVNRFGRRLYDIYFGPYTAKVWGRDPSKLSASWAAQRVAVVDLWDLVLRTFGLRKGYNGFQHSPYKPDFWYPPTGVGHIYERMAEEVGRAGGTVDLDRRVVAVNHSNGAIDSVESDGPDGKRTDRSDYFISTIPISDLVRALNPAPPTDVLEAADALKFRSMIFVFLMLKRDSVSNDHWIYIPDPKIIFNRLSEMRNFSPDAAPDGHTSLTAEITCDDGDEVWTMPESEVYERTVAGLEAIGLIKRSEVVGHFFARSRHAYPTYDRNFEANVGKVAYFLAGIENLVVAGRQGLFRYINQDHAIEMGFCAADELTTQQLGSRVGRVGKEPVYFG